jgi:Sulfatase-modifying factor enzyme 1
MPSSPRREQSASKALASEKLSIGRAGRHPGRYAFGDDEAQLGEYAWYGKIAEVMTRPVGTKKPNAFGLYDMHGNVRQWINELGDYKQRGSLSAEWRKILWLFITLLSKEKPEDPVSCFPCGLSCGYAPLAIERSRRDLVALENRANLLAGRFAHRPLDLDRLLAILRRAKGDRALDAVGGCQLRNKGILERSVTIACSARYGYHYDRRSDWIYAARRNGVLRKCRCRQQHKRKQKRDCPHHHKDFLLSKAHCTAITKEMVMDEDAHAYGRGGQHASVWVGLAMWAIVLAVLWLA